MKKSIISLCFFCLLQSNAYAWTIWCANCSTEWTQLMDRITNIEDLRYMTMSYSESIKQTYQQIELLKNNIQQYDNMIKNTNNLPQNLLSMLTSNLSSLAIVTKNLSTMKADIAGMGAIYDKLYPDQSYYKDIANLGYEEQAEGNLIVNTELDDMSKRIDEATKATFQLSGQQLEDLHDTGKLEQYINDLIQTPEGQMQALSSANQLSNLQLQEARQLRELLATQAQSDLAIQTKEEKESQLSEELAREIMDMSDLTLTPQVKELPLF